MAGRPPPRLTDARSGRACGSLPLARYIDEFVTFLSSEVNPQELTAAPKFFEVLSRCLPKKALLVKLAVAIDHYDRASAEKGSGRSRICAPFTLTRNWRNKRRAKMASWSCRRPGPGPRPGPTGRLQADRECIYIPPVGYRLTNGVFMPNHGPA